MTFWSALLLGIVASVHCAGMCGGLQMAFQATPGGVAMRTPAQAFQHLLLLNAGRILTYIIAGLIFSSIGYGVLAGVNVVGAINGLRAISGGIILLIGLQILFSQQRPFQLIERLGAKLWQTANKHIDLSSGRPSQHLRNGMLWGLLPCGLVYGVLLTTVFASDTITTVLVMLGFGIGTLPSMLMTGMASKQLTSVLRSNFVQISGGLFFIIGGVLLLTAPWWVTTSFIQDYPQLLNLAFCVTK